MTGVTMTVNGQAATTVAPGAVITVTVSFTSAVAVTGATLGVSVFDPVKTQQPGGVWETGVSFTAGQTVVAIPLTFTAPSTPGTYTVGAGAWLGDGSNPFWDGAAQTFRVTAPIVTDVPCLPRVQWPLNVKRGDIPPTVSTTNTKYAVYVCAMPNGYITVDVLFNYSDIAAYIEPVVDNILTLGQINAIAAPLQTPPTAAESAFITPIVQSARPKATVGYSALSATRAVYTLTPAGTASTPVPGESVATAKPCDETQRIPGTALYGVSGQPNALKAGALLPQGSYSSCTLTFPIAPN